MGILPCVFASSRFTDSSSVFCNFIRFCQGMYNFILLTSCPDYTVERDDIAFVEEGDTFQFMFEGMDCDEDFSSPMR